MTIRLELTIEPGETLQQVLQRAGIMRAEPQEPWASMLREIERQHAYLKKAGIPVMERTGVTPDNISAALREKYGAEPVITPAEAAEQAGLEPPTTLHERVQAGSPPEQPAEPATPRRRGRPRKDAPTTIEQVAAQTDLEEHIAAATPATAYEVRRYGGELDYEFVKPEDAAARLIELINQAGDGQALESLAQANEALAEALPEALSESLSAAFDAASTALQPKKPEGVFTEEGMAQIQANIERAIGPAPVAWPMCEDKVTPLTQVTLDWQGARNAIFAIASGPAPQFGVPVGSELLAKFGVARLRDLEQTDPKVAEIAREAAKALGLPVVENGGLL